MNVFDKNVEYDFSNVSKKMIQDFKCFEKNGQDFKCLSKISNVSKKRVQNVSKKMVQEFECFRISNVSKKMVQDFKCFEKNGYRFLNEKYRKNYGKIMDER